MRSLPLAAQERWKRLDDGKWFQRLEDNIPAEDVLDGRYRGVGRGAGAFDPKTVDKLHDRRRRRRVKEIDAAVRQGLTARRPSSCSAGCSSSAAPAPTRPARRAATASACSRSPCSRLDTLGHMDRLLDALPDAYLLNEMWRGEVLEVLGGPRPAPPRAPGPRACSSYGIFDWAVTAREAWLAFQLVRSLPAGRPDPARGGGPRPLGADQVEHDRRDARVARHHGDRRRRRPARPATASATGSATAGCGCRHARPSCAR